ncbi:GNAT family N-acetyltransferase [Celerinatantimonas diazotrophica]|uniref:Putative acetyltransferase n=1 Tax=Celerinatantimonas diazotrophica TaxID=412034 RepID=A0A4R1K2L7_9GAMM|nr:GNAT family N-acetyltransferase [Celerinatantimonas diazotrophica]TCK57943.1 putative acetyltransferase [Celerinatantimonas diazotrophica]CAG9297989.1 hypothetical protein CEDIAZO_03181 [Celerinatantimonas diazotrophica]
MAVIELIKPEHDAQIEQIVHTVLAEFGASGPGYACADPQLKSLSHFYRPEKMNYWVALNEHNKVLGGAGIGPLTATEGFCELQKMYLLPEGRSLGIGQQLMQTCLAFAQHYYQACYLETLDHMDSAQKLYRRNGFKRISQPLGQTGHSRCNTWYLRSF